MEKVTSKIKKSESLKIVVLSDIHAFDSVETNEQEPSYLDMSAAQSPKTHPFSGLFSLIEENKLSADIVVCAGDLGNKAKPSTIQYTWKYINELKAKLHAELVAATPGNHDHDSRSKYCDFDPKSSLQSLDPPFPFGDEILNDRFWARNYAIKEGMNYRLILLNSSAFHGIKDEYEHGRVVQRTLDYIERELSDKKISPVNLFICHHHPQKHEDIGLTDYEVMVGGQKLLELLGKGNFGDWMVIHGHKHHPKITYAAGATKSPVVLSAGSFSAVLEPYLTTIASNQFYLIEFHLSNFDYGLVGTFEAWDWQKGYGWRPAGATSGLPQSGGFGYREHPRPLGKKIKKCMGKNPFIAWDKLIIKMPELQYLIPDDLENLITEIKISHSLNVQMNDGIILQIGKET